MAEVPGEDDPVTERPLGLAPFLDEDADWDGLMTRVHRSIARRELSGQAVELGARGLPWVLLEYLKALVDLAGGKGRRERAD